MKNLKERRKRGKGRNRDDKIDTKNRNKIIRFAIYVKKVD